MKLSSANILRSGKKEIRAIGDSCDPACFTWHGCANSKPNGVCEGFVLMNGETRKHMNKILNEDDAIYVQNCVHRIQNGSNEDGIVREVLRFITPEESEPTQRPEGFSYMAKCARGVQNTPTQEPEPETRSTEGLRGMLDAISRPEQTRTPILNTVRMTGMLRQIDESQFPQFCDPEKCPKDFARHCSANRPENHGKPCIYITPRNR